MKEVFENIKEKIKNQPIEQFVDTNGNWDLVQTVLDCCCEAVDRVKEEYNNGWIPCSERLPDKSGWFLCTQEYHSLTNRKFIKVTTELVEFYDNKWRRAKNLVVTHWQPLPHPYQPKGE